MYSNNKKHLLFINHFVFCFLISFFRRGSCLLPASVVAQAVSRTPTALVHFPPVQQHTYLIIMSSVSDRLSIMNKKLARMETLLSKYHEQYTILEQLAKGSFRKEKKRKHVKRNGATKKNKVCTKDVTVIDGMRIQCSDKPIMPLPLEKGQMVHFSHATDFGPVWLKAKVAAISYEDNEIVLYKDHNAYIVTFGDVENVISLPTPEDYYTKAQSQLRALIQ